jgi:hypothetical protein
MGSHQNCKYQTSCGLTSGHPTSSSDLLSSLSGTRTAGASSPGLHRARWRQVPSRAAARPPRRAHFMCTFRRTSRQSTVNAHRPPNGYSAPCPAVTGQPIMQHVSPIHQSVSRFQRPPAEHHGSFARAGRESRRTQQGHRRCPRLLTCLSPIVAHGAEGHVRPPQVVDDVALDGPEMPKSRRTSFSWSSIQNGLDNLSVPSMCLRPSSGQRDDLTGVGDKQRLDRLEYVQQ